MNMNKHIIVKCNLKFGEYHRNPLVQTDGNLGNTNIDQGRHLW